MLSAGGRNLSRPFIRPSVATRGIVGFARHQRVVVVEGVWGAWTAARMDRREGSGTAAALSCGEGADQHLRQRDRRMGGRANPLEQAGHSGTDAQRNA